MNAASRVCWSLGWGCSSQFTQVSARDPLTYLEAKMKTALCLTTAAFGLATFNLSAASIIQFLASYYDVTEGDGAISISVERTNDLATGASVEFATTYQNSATPAADYTETVTRLVFLAGETNKIVTVAILNDGELERAETFGVKLRNPAGGAELGARSEATVAITDNDGYAGPECQVYRVREDEGMVRIWIYRGNDGDSPATVKYATRDGEAKAGQDFIQTAGTLEFVPGEKVKCVSIPILNDFLRETNETFDILLSNPKGMSFPWGGMGVPITILDNDSFPGVQFESEFCWVSENDGALTLRVFRNNDLDLGAFTVDYATHDGTALAGQDYVETKGTLTFAPGELAQSLTIPVLTDGMAEWDKEFSVALVHPTGGAFLGTNATARITLVEYAPNPLVLEIIEHVQSADLMGLMRRITGEEPVVVGGDVRTIISRHTTSATLRQATQLVFERFRALGLEAGYQHWDVAQLKNWMQEALGFYIDVPGLADRNVVGVKAGRSCSSRRPAGLRTGPIGRFLVSVNPNGPDYTLRSAPCFYWPLYSISFLTGDRC